MLSFFKNLMGQEAIDYADLKSKDVMIIDVRTPMEFAQGHYASSVNIPLNEVTSHIPKIKSANKPVVLCCKSGGRAGSVMGSFKQAGIEVYNGGSWSAVKAGFEQ